MTVIPDFKAITLKSFITQNVAPGSRIYTDARPSPAWSKRDSSTSPARSR